MANDSQILSALRKLSAYYGKEPPKEQARVYLEMLADVEPAALEYAAQAWIKRSPFFPRINELLQTARTYHPPPISAVQALIHCQRLLERKFWREGLLDAQEWDSLAARFEINGCDHLASRCRSRLQQTLDQLDLEKDPDRWKEIRNHTSQKWQQQADQLQRYYATGEMPEKWR